MIIVVVVLFDYVEKIDDFTILPRSTGDLRLLPEFHPVLHQPVPADCSPSSCHLLLEGDGLPNRDQSRTSRAACRSAA